MLIHLSATLKKSVTWGRGGGGKGTFSSFPKIFAWCQNSVHQPMDSCYLYASLTRTSVWGQFILFSFAIFTVLPGVPKGVSIEYINSSAVRVGWNLPFPGSNVTNHYVELSIASGNVIKRQSSYGKQSVIFTRLLSNTQYKVRVQAENAAGNGSSSQYVSFKTNESKSRQRSLCKFVRYDALNPTV